MDKQCVMIGVNAPVIPWMKLEEGEVLRYFGLRVMQETDRAYQAGYRVFSACLGNIVDLYLAYELIGLKSENPDVAVRIYDPDTLIPGNLTEEQLRMRGEILLKSSFITLMQNTKTERQKKKELISAAGYIIAATASFCDPASHIKVAEYKDIQGDREFIEVPLMPHIKISSALPDMDHISCKADGDE